MTTDYLIIGQGICGTFLSWNLTRQGKKVLVMDDAQPFSASRVASGVINPVTGRQVVTTWMAETLLPYTWQAYNAIGADIGVDVIKQADIVVFPPSQQMRDAYNKRIGEANSYIKQVEQARKQVYEGMFYQYYGIAEICPVWLVDLLPLFEGWKAKLNEAGALVEEKFEEAHLSIFDDHIGYKNIRAEKIIFCNGTNTFNLPYFKNLPYVFNKGEALVVDIPGLPRDNIYKADNSTMVPWYNGLWWVGSSYENNYEHSLPTEQFKLKKLQELGMCLKLPFTVVGHVASLRPAVAIERRPFVGLHPALPSLGILNGMGTKGCSLAPYFAEQLAANIVEGKPVDPLADVARFKRSLGTVK